MEKKYFCNKYGEYVDIDRKPCPHPDDFCQYRTQCIINALCMEDADCRKKRREQLENTR
jgi:hypothetical protein